MEALLVVLLFGSLIWLNNKRMKHRKYHTSLTKAFEKNITENLFFCVFDNNTTIKFNYKKIKINAENLHNVS